MERIVKIIGEENFNPIMQDSVAPWLARDVQDGYLTAPDGMKLHYRYNLVPESRAAIVMIHGFCEFFGKYHELAWYFAQAGFSFFFLENRGHGLSGRETDQFDLVQIHSYDEYVEDAALFIREIVKPAVPDQKLLLYCHSMGGAIGTLFLEKYPEVFSAAVLSSPMHGIQLGPIKDWMVAVMYAFKKITGKADDLSVGNSHWSGKPDYNENSGQSRARFWYQYNMRVADDAYKTCAATNRWAYQSTVADHKLVRDAAKVQIPVILFQAEKDSLVRPEPQNSFAAGSAHTRIVRIPSEHEIFNNASLATRMGYYKELFAFLDAQSDGQTTTVTEA
ncbi:MAG: alpha/beta fold hydrolase [Firmicutes bacterium]|nr:alpha/beta fold hydrolase [Bacillota bacterium]